MMDDFWMGKLSLVTMVNDGLQPLTATIIANDKHE